MGQDKAHLPWGAHSLLEHVVEGLRSVTDEVIIVGKDARRFAHIRARIVEDRVADAHALGGVYTGLLAASQDACFICGCDMPFLSNAIIRYLAAQAEGVDWVVPETSDGIQPLHAIYRKSSLAAIEQALQEQRWELHRLAAVLKTKIVGEEALRELDPSGHSFFNINTLADYERAGALQSMVVVWETCCLSQEGWCRSHASC